MPALPPEQNYNVSLHFHCNAETREYVLRVCYYSNHPPARHEKIHDSLREKAFDWLLRHGHSPDPDKVKIEFRRVEQAEKNVVPVFDKIDEVEEEEKNKIQLTMGKGKQDTGN